MDSQPVLRAVGHRQHVPLRWRDVGPDAARFPNLYLAGDWTQCTLNAGCMEAATMSGMLCSNAIDGHPVRSAIIGVDF